MESIVLRDGRAVPRLGLGCWAIGGPMNFNGVASGYGPIDDAEALRAVRRGYDLGIRLFDTAEAYGVGHSETLLGEALAGCPDAVLITKFGFTTDAATRTLSGVDVSPANIRRAVEGSLRRLRRERLDVLLLHVNELPVDEAGPVFDTLETLRREGKIGAFGWSTDYPDRLAAVGGREGFAAVEFDLNVLIDAPAMVAGAEARGLLALCRLPLAMGLLSERFGPASRLPASDVRGSAQPWLQFFKDGRPSAHFLERRERIRDLLRADGRSVPQGALAWLLARSPRAVPLPGFRSVAQVEENVAVLEKGPLPPGVMADIKRVLER